MQAAITSKGQITPPKALREQLHLAPGGRVELIVDDNDVVRMVPRTTSVTRLKGMLPKNRAGGVVGGDGCGDPVGGPLSGAMMGLDTNVLVRCITQDDPQQAG